MGTPLFDLLLYSVSQKKKKMVQAEMHDFNYQTVKICHKVYMIFKIIK